MLTMNKASTFGKKIINPQIKAAIEQINTAPEEISLVIRAVS